MNGNAPLEVRLSETGGENALEAAVTSVQRKKLEAEPLEGTDATGRKVPAAPSPEGETRPNPSGRKQNAAKTAPQVDSTAAENNKKID